MIINKQTILFAASFIFVTQAIPDLSAKDFPKRNRHRASPRGHASIESIGGAHYDSRIGSEKRIVSSKPALLLLTQEEVRAQLQSSTLGSDGSEPAAENRALAEQMKIGQKLIQWEAGQITVDHCSVSQVAILLKPNGECILSLRADQNAKKNEDGEAVKPNSQEKQFLLRNEFEVTIRLRAGSTVAGSGNEAIIGTPRLQELGPYRFFVERGDPKVFMKDVTLENIEANFKQIDHAEIEFRYFK